MGILLLFQQKMMATDTKLLFIQCLKNLRAIVLR